MQKRVQQYMEKYQMLKPGDRVIAGVSGGADSVALFHLLYSFRKSMQFELAVVHVNHQLRGDEALRDQEFVEALCEQYEIPCSVYRRPVRKIARERGIGLEEAGRQVRQEAFTAELEEWQGTRIALAHHRNDQAETMLHHLCRGSGLRGLCGIQPVQGEKIRPLLCLERREIEQYIEDNGLSYVTDSTNEEDAYTRNRIRHQVLGTLEQQVNPKTVAHMAQAAEHLQMAEAYLSEKGRKLLEKYGSFTENGVHLSGKLFAEPQILQEYVYMEAAARVLGTRRDLTSVHVEQIVALSGQQVGRKIALPRCFLARRTYEGVQIEHVRPSVVADEGMPVVLPVPGKVASGEITVKSRVFSYHGEQIPEKKYTKWLNYDRINGTLQIRSRRAGDTLALHLSGGHKKLKDYFIDCKIPREQRNSIQLLTAGSEVLWVIGYRLSEAYKVDIHTQNVLEVIYEGGRNDGK